MAFWKYIIADSGGSNTNWAFCAENGEVTYLQTTGLHPKYVLRWGTEKWLDLSEELGTIEGETLFFYGSGCSQPEARGQLTAGFRSIGFGEVTVFPDTLGACRACCVREPGAVAILGTGSVLLEYDGTAVVKRAGGYGSLIGDEGSGFHFARLIVRAYLDGKINTPELTEILGSQAEVLAHLAGPGAQEWLATIAGMLASVSLSAWHEHNLQAFLDAYLGQIGEIFPKRLHVVGSYGFHQREMLAQLLQRSGWELGKVVLNPIEQLVNFHHLPD